MAGRVEGKVALVTGGASGIGRGCAERLAQEGAVVVVTDLQDDKGAQTVAAIEAMGGKASYLHHDVTSELHGALLDAELLAEVYLAMTRGQESLMIGLEDEPSARETDAAGVPVARVALKVLRASDAERQAHEAVLDDIVKANKGLCLWRPPEPVAAS